MSGLLGVNIIKGEPKAHPWYQGPTLFEVRLRHWTLSLSVMPLRAVVRCRALWQSLRLPGQSAG